MAESGLAGPAGVSIPAGHWPIDRRSSRRRVALVISSLGAGGAERVMSIMANYWAARARPVALITLDHAATDFYALDPRVTRVALDAAGDSHHAWDALAHNARRIARLRRALRDTRADVVVSFMPSANVLALIAGELERVPVIVAERIDPEAHPVPPVWARLRRMTYRRASAVVVQTPEVRQWAERLAPSEIVHTIPNPIVPPPAARRVSAEQRQRSAHGARRVVAMGRLHVQKGFDILLRAFARCRATAPDWSLVMIGEGEERGRLEALASELGVAESVWMPGQVRDPFEVLCGADLFVLSSRWEGFPNALLEAMASGVAVIAADCRSGPRHILRDGIDGILVPPEDVDALAESMHSLMVDDARRAALAGRAVEVSHRFSLDRVMARWDRLLDCVAPMPGESARA